MKTRFHAPSFDVGHHAVGLRRARGARRRSPAASQKDIVDTAVAAGSFNTLAAALKAAGLVDTLKGKGPFTVFAPTDAAFAKLPAGTVEDCSSPRTRPSSSRSSPTTSCRAGSWPPRLTGDDSAPTVNGQPLTIESDHGVVTVGGAHRPDRHRLQQRRDPRDRHRAAPELTELSTKEKDHGKHRSDRDPGRIIQDPREGREGAVLVETLSSPGPFTVFASTDAAFARLPRAPSTDPSSRGARTS